MNTILFLLLSSALIVIVYGQGTPAASSPAPQRARHHHRGFDMREKFTIECLNASNQWGPGPICQETNEEISFNYGTDNFFYCGLSIKDEETYQWARRVVSQKEAWSCRVPISPARNFFLPLNIPLWGVVEPDHCHMNNHMNFVFHGAHGRIIAASAYPVQDRFDFVRPGSLINMHGPIHWFRRHSFQAFGATKNSRDPSESRWMVVVGACVVTMLAMLLVFAVVYQWVLKPRLIKKMIKQE